MTEALQDAAMRLGLYLVLGACVIMLAVQMAHAFGG